MMHAILAVAAIFGASAFQQHPGSLIGNARSSEVSGLAGAVFPPDPHLKNFLPIQRMDPLYMHSSGCTGSSIILDIAREIMELHGVVAYIHGDKMYEEVIVPSKNPFYTEKRGIRTAMHMLAKAAETNDTTLMFKSGGLATEVFDEVAPALVEIRTRVVYMERTNALDYATCMARDCFEDDVGYPVDKHGKKSSLCFGRRLQGDTADDTDIKVMYNTAKLVPHLLKLLGRSQRGRASKLLAQHGFKNVTTVSMEGLLAYETTDTSGLNRSVEEWSKLLDAWGMAPQQRIIEAYLKPNCGTRDAAPQMKGIYNWGEVQKAMIKEGPALQQFLHDYNRK